jgi:hypothetical protein
MGAGSEVENSVRSVNSSRQPVSVCDFTLNYLEALDQSEVAGGEVVVDQNVETILAESSRRVAPNIACAADYKNRHRIPRVGSGAERKSKIRLAGKQCPALDIRRTNKNKSFVSSEMGISGPTMDSDDECMGDLRLG